MPSLGKQTLKIRRRALRWRRWIFGECDAAGSASRVLATPNCYMMCRMTDLLTDDSPLPDADAPLFAALNEAQGRAVAAVEGAVLVLAGAGTATVSAPIRRRAGGRAVDMERR